jgi:hypothetical protein
VVARGPRDVVRGVRAGAGAPCLVPSHALSVLLGDGEGRLEAPSTELAPRGAAGARAGALHRDERRIGCGGNDKGAKGGGGNS